MRPVYLSRAFPVQTRKPGSALPRLALLALFFPGAITLQSAETHSAPASIVAFSGPVSPAPGSLAEPVTGDRTLVAVDPQRLDRFIVTAARTRQAVDSVAFSARLIDGADLRSAPTATLDGALRAIDRKSVV